VLRLLEGEKPFVSPVTYLAEVASGHPALLLEPWTKSIADDPLRAAYARPGGPQADLDWAARHVTFTGSPVQVRTWNLSSIWRIPTATGLVWLKHVPPFFAHEPAMLRALDGRALHGTAPVPHLIAGEPGRMLVADVPGHDCYDATLPQLEAMVDTLVDLQTVWAGRVDEILTLGAPDWRSSAFIPLARAVVERDATAELRTVLDPFVGRLPQAFADLDSCGLPNTFVHGDFHPGNVRWTSDGPVLLDWGDVGVGHPLFDLPAFLERAGPHTAELEARWLERWARACPGNDPHRAAKLIAPIAALRQAIVYRGFLDGIEETERVYHRTDVPEWLGIAAELSAAAAG
jgi:Ser/Thr protein kinase RdoA (MazF antagonist)